MCPRGRFRRATASARSTWSSNAASRVRRTWPRPPSWRIPRPRIQARQKTRRAPSSTALHDAPRFHDFPRSLRLPGRSRRRRIRRRSRLRGYPRAERGLIVSTTFAPPVPATGGVFYSPRCPARDGRYQPRQSMHHIDQLAARLSARRPRPRFPTRLPGAPAPFSPHWATLSGSSPAENPAHDFLMLTSLPALVDLRPGASEEG